MNKKIYKGYELIKAMTDKEIEVGARFKDKFDNIFIYKYCDLEDNYANLFILDGEQEYPPDYSMFVDNSFEVLENNTEDIEDLSPYKLMESPYMADLLRQQRYDEFMEHLKQSELELVNKIKELVKIINKIRKEEMNNG